MQNTSKLLTCYGEISFAYGDYLERALTSGCIYQIHLLK
jgi:hypothetical protein